MAKLSPFIKPQKSPKPKAPTHRKFPHRVSVFQNCSLSSLQHGIGQKQHVHCRTTSCVAKILNRKVVPLRRRIVAVGIVIVVILISVTYSVSGPPDVEFHQIHRFNQKAFPLKIRLLVVVVTIIVMKRRRSLSNSADICESRAARENPPVAAVAQKCSCEKMMTKIKHGRGFSTPPRRPSVCSVLPFVATLRSCHHRHRRRRPWISEAFKSPKHHVVAFMCRGDTSKNINSSGK